jgi:hypothetical protein
MAEKRPGADAYLDALDAPAKRSPARSTPKSRPRGRAEPTRSDAAGKTRVTLYLSEELWQEARTVILKLGAAGMRPASLSQLVDDAIARELATLRTRHNGGKPFPKHRGGLPGGRPREKR